MPHGNGSVTRPTRFGKPTLKPLDSGPETVYSRGMKETKTTMKLTAAQAYAAQLKSDKRARAIENRDPIIAADNARINAMYATEGQLAPAPTLVARRDRRAWTVDELTLALELYLVSFCPVSGGTDWVSVAPIFAARYPERGEGAFRMVLSQISAYDVRSPLAGLTGSVALRQILCDADPVRFSAAA